MTDPSPYNRRNCQYERNQKGALVIRDSNDSAQQNQRKQKRRNNVSAFDFLNKREKEKKQSERNEKLHVGKATKPRYS
jgi:hypothetical protein